MRLLVFLPSVLFHVLGLKPKSGNNWVFIRLTYQLAACSDFIDAYQTFYFEVLSEVNLLLHHFLNARQDFIHFYHFQTFLDLVTRLNISFCMIVLYIRSVLPQAALIFLTKRMRSLQIVFELIDFDLLLTQVLLQL